MRYNHKKIEIKWQKAWARNKFSIWGVNDFAKKPYYVLDMFPYPSGDGLHTGHVEGYTASDIYSRFLRMKRYNILHPMGWDAFGLPAENYAIERRINPKVAVEKNIRRFRKQLQSLGFSYDWQREINTTDPYYYKWTQWIFLKLLEKGLAYEKEAQVNWCPSCKTVLADEEASGGVCERCGSATELKNLTQWHLKITAYAERLLRDLEKLDWPENIKEMQRNWIGKSEGLEIDFKVDGLDKTIRVFTTRPDTLFGATFLLLAPEHPFGLSLVSHNYRLMAEAYVREKTAKKISAKDISQAKEKTGVFTGSYAINPINNELVPIWISDYVLMEYGTGAIMAVPAHDLRDFEFAQKFNLPIKTVVVNPQVKQTLPYEGEGILVDSGDFSGLNSDIAKNEIAKFLASKNAAERKITFKLRDWIFSRQRYWGEPIPVIKCRQCGVVPVPEKDLPVKLPYVKSYAPTGEPESPLAKIKSWVNVKCPFCKGQARRETNTMPQWAGSNWYYLRYIDPKNKKSLANIKKLEHWLPVDLYLGGAEHAVLHLLYARFIHKFLYDIGAVPAKEPFQKLVNQGIILGSDGQKMSKSRGNVVNPDDIVKEFGADTLRMYEMFLGPLQDSKPWDPKSIIGIFRFLNRVWNLVLSWGKAKSTKQLRRQKVGVLTGVSKKLEPLVRLMHQTIKKVEDDIANFRFNTAVSALMEYQRTLMWALSVHKNLPKEFIENLILMLFPFSPHISQELWHIIGNKGFLDKHGFPRWQWQYVKKTTYNLIIQVNGKTRLTVDAPLDASQEKIKTLALSQPKIKNFIGRKQIKREIFVKNRLINFVI